MSVLPGEGTFVILYGEATYSVGTRTHRGYIARPDVAGSFPVLLMLGPVTSGAKDLSRRLARRGLAIVALEPVTGRDATDLLRWVRAPGTPWADPDRLIAVVAGTGVPTGAVIEHSDAIVLLDAADLDVIGRPGLGLFGADGDEAAAARTAYSSRAGWQLVFYASTGSGFWDTGSDGYAEAAADDAVDRIAAFIEAALQ